MSASGEVRELWRIYRNVFTRPDATRAQRRETKRAFYTGAIVVVSILSRMDDMTQDDAVALLQAVTMEVGRFAQKELLRMANGARNS